ncbi:DASH complex subunit Dam1-domain-containing protein [Amylostereum chailletii]|nr:DASH complex subunit Dam1-domain-containing protein [Amylostereum chailletii]
MPGPTPHRTPLRRVSQGSLSAMSRSRAHPDAPYGLGFLEPAMAELADEVDTLQTNVEGLRELGDALQTFNESFASWLYVMNMNALTVDWPQAPTENSYILAKRRAEEDAQAAYIALQSRKHQPEPFISDKTTATEDANATAAADNTVMNETMTAGKPATVKVKKKGQLKMTAKEKKERSIAVDKAVMSLPLEFRGNDPGLRRNVETVIEALMDNAGKGMKLIELIKPPELNQARVNKCLIAMVNRKIVTKNNSTGTVLYHWQGVPG